MSTLRKDTLHFTIESQAFLEPHLPPKEPGNPSPYPFTTITFATSLDSQLALSPGAPTALSGPQSKAMTHYLRSRHDAILIGVGTAVADNPSLNCRLEGVGGYGGEGLLGQPRPIILDPIARWDFTEDHKIFRLCREGKGRAPYIVTVVTNPGVEKEAILHAAGGKFIVLKATATNTGQHKLEWGKILEVLGNEGLKSVMVEGGAAVINSLLVPEYFPIISSIIVTIAPTWLGQGGVVVSPPRICDNEGNVIAAVRLDHPKWYPLGEDVVLCGKIKL